jgi:NCAIR mutase (PurE)-related protein
MYEDLSKLPLQNGAITYHKMARIVSMEASSLKDRNLLPKAKIRVVVATAGTTDLPVAEEAAVTLEAAGCEVDRIFDCGVAGKLMVRLGPSWSLERERERLANLVIVFLFRFAPDYSRHS